MTFEMSTSMIRTLLDCDEFQDLATVRVSMKHLRGKADFSLAKL